ncbi:MAG: hypothetical protein R3D25_14650 [Geminicoccaceae bacterium]
MSVRARVSPESGSPEAAILVADALVGYSRAMSRDEGAALDAFGASRRLIDPLIREHGGRIFATAGDSVLAEFAQADGAVGCAVAIQRGVEAAIAAGALLMVSHGRASGARASGGQRSAGGHGQRRGPARRAL